MSESMMKNRDSRRSMMLEEPIAKVLIVVAVPMIISMLIDSLYNMADAYFVSQLGKTATGAVGINDSLSHFIWSISMGFGVGASSYISRLMGAKRENEASCVGTTIIITAVLVICVFAAIALLFVEPLVTFLGASSSTKQYSLDYARFLLIAAPFTVGSVVLSQLLRAEGSTQFSMFGMVIGCMINVILDPLFITVMGLEVAGAAIATAISKIISFAILLFPFLRGKTVLEIKLRYFTPKWEIYKEVAKIGIPSFLRSSMLSVSTLISNNVASSFSDAALAAASVSNRCTKFVSSAILGFGQGFQPVVGYCWGAKRYKRVRDAFWTCSAIGAAAVAVIGTVMLIFAPTIIGIFASDDADIIAIGSLIIRSQCITMIFHVWVIIANGLFMALGKAVIAAILGLARQFICLVPCVLILSVLLGIDGFAIAQAVADVLCVIIAFPLVMKLMREIRALEMQGS